MNDINDRLQSGETPLHRCLFNNFDAPQPTDDYIRTRWRMAVKSNSSASLGSALPTHGSFGSINIKPSSTATTLTAMTTIQQQQRRTTSHRGRLMSTLLRFGADLRILTNTDESVTLHTFVSLIDILNKLFLFSI